MSENANDIIRSIRSTLEGVGATARGITEAFERFVEIPPRLTYPVVWCKDHDQLEGDPGCLLARARRGE